MSHFVISTFYEFFTFSDYQSQKPPLLKFCHEHNIFGTIIMASEGINATIGATAANIAALYQYLSTIGIKDLSYKESAVDFMPFLKMKVRLKKEIVTLGVSDLAVKGNEGEYVESAQWDEFIAQDEVLLIDTRNKYETQLGKFSKSLDPETKTFKEFIPWVEKNLMPYQRKKIAMYCTGGIRCEKSTAYLKKIGFNQVYHLKGGILQYFADTANVNNKFQGSCFVFDDRVNLNDNLEALCGPSSKAQMFAK
jgi:UPF0176 protein